VLPSIGFAVKPSRYNIIIPYCKDYLLYNSLSGTMIKIEAAKMSLVNEVLNKTDHYSGKITHKNGRKHKNLITILYNNQFLIPKDKNELAELMITRRGLQYGNKRLGLTLVPTTNCNFGCPYCFIKKSSSIKMTDIVQDAIVNFVKTNIKRHSICGVSWFGGEPLLAFDVIEKLSKRLIKICQQNEISYDSDIITNGYLLNEVLIDKLIKCKIKKIQITLDGPQNVHDKRRFLKNKRGTYNTIIKNIVAVLEKADYFDRLLIRINIDKSNSHKANELICSLKSIDTKNKLDIYPARTRGEGSDYFTVSEFADVMCKLCPQLGQKKIISPNKHIHCMAETVSHFSVNADGDIYKCHEDFGRKEFVIGNILDNDVMHGIGNKNRTYSYEFLNYNPNDFYACRKCNILPLCMGGCTKNRINHGGKPLCSEYKYSLSSYLIRYANQELVK
jgi:uncharacterized protein